MTAETSLPLSGPRTTGHAPALAVSAADWSRSGSVAALVEDRSTTAPVHVAQAPGRLDVLGGMSEYAGVTSLNMPIGGPIRVAAQASDADTITIRATPVSNGHAPVVISLDALRELVQRGAAPSAGPGPLNAEHGVEARCACGALVEGVRTGLFDAPRHGIDVTIHVADSDLSHGADQIPLMCASLAALGSCFGVVPGSERLIDAARAAHRHWFGQDPGFAEVACVVRGGAGRLSETRNDPCALGRDLALPEGFVFAAVDSGATEDGASLKSDRVRAASMMGRRLIGRMIGHGRDVATWRGQLSGVPVADYVEKYRDRLPTKLKGSEFIERVGEWDDGDVPIEPGHVYRVRSRTEHHIYEQERVRQFFELVEVSGRSGAPEALQSAGELLYASHWSYGQRCGLGSLRTDWLVNTLRRRAASAGVLGARISGRGCGGVVCVLLRDSDEAWEAVRSVAREFHGKFGHGARVLRSTVPGVLVSGARVL